jgi:hypothetical protein
MSARLDLRIEEIVCDGLPPLDGRRFGRALERALTEVIAERSLPDSLLRDRREVTIIAPAVALPATATPDIMAREVARAIYEGLRR